jgi:kumamolisin
MSSSKKDKHRASTPKKEKGRITVPGSERTAPPNARIVGAPDPHERIEVTVLVRPRSTSKGFAASAKEMGSLSPKKRKYLSREEFAAAHGANQDDVEKVEEFAHEHNLTVVEVSLPRRSIKLSGTVADLSAAFGVYLANYEHTDGIYRSRTGSIHVPHDLGDIVQGVFGFTNRPVAKPHFRRFKKQEGATHPHTNNASFTPNQIAQLYNFPSDVNGQGQCIGIIELGGGYRTSDLKAYFGQLGIPKPKILAISVDHGHNHPTTSDSADGEVMLDIEVAGAVAPGAKIVVYFAPNTDQGFIDAITTAIHDARNKPSVISISWGGHESAWTAQSMQGMDQAFQEAASLGVTVCCAAGDDGSSDIRVGQEQDDGLLHADFPASSPFALGCGGTRLEGSGNTITKEVVWNEGRNGGATGGGVSNVFGLPTWQSGAHVPPSANPGRHIGRGVPDVAGDADLATGYIIRVDGQQFSIGGTSAVAPLWAGLIALINQKLGHPLGYLNPVLYGLSANSGVFHDITEGNNDIDGNKGAYKAQNGWDACTGLGSPDGAKLVQALSK